MKKKPIPEFKNEAEERAFWEVQDSADYVDWSKKAAQVGMPKLKMSVKPRGGRREQVRIR